MRLSIAGAMNFNMFGIPMVGPVACQSTNGTAVDDELCARWIQLSSFFPLAVFPNDAQTKMAEPYKSWVTNARYDRLQYLQLWYTCFIDAYRRGQSCFDPVFFHFPEEDVVMQSNNTENSFIIAEAVMVSPVVKP